MRKFAFLLAVLVLFLGGLAWRQWTSATGLATALNQTTLERDTLKQRVAALEKRERALQDETAVLREQQSSAPVSQPMGGGRTMTFRSNGGGGGAGGPMMALESPEMRKLMAVGQRGQLDTHYAALFKTLGLSPEQLEKFKQLLVDKQNTALDVMAAARSQGLVGPDSRSQVQSLMQQANKEMDDGIKDLIGDSAYQQYQQFDRTQTQRAIVDQLASRLSYTDAPLTPQQTEQMVQLLAETAPPAPPTGPGGNAVVYSSAIRVTSGSGGPGGAVAAATPFFTTIAGGPTAQITSDTVNRAQSVLSPTQVGALQEIQAEQQAQQQMGQLMRQSIETQGGAVHFQGATIDGGPPPPPPSPGG